MSFEPNEGLGVNQVYICNESNDPGQIQIKDQSKKKPYGSETSQMRGLNEPNITDNA